MRKIDFQKLDRPISFRVPHKIHSKYKSLSGFERKEIQYKMIIKLKKLLEDIIK